MSLGLLFILFGMMLPVLIASVPDIIKARRRAPELEAPKEPEYDEYGYRKDLDFHYIRSREIETGLSVSELTTCPDQNCGICFGTRENLAVVPSLVALPEPYSTEEIDEILAEKDRIIAEEKQKAAELERKLEEEATYLVDYPVSKFRKSPVPKTATFVMKERKDGCTVDIEWTWDGKHYVQVLEGYTIHDEEAGILRKARRGTYKSKRNEEEWQKAINDCTFDDLLRWADQGHVTIEELSANYYKVRSPIGMFYWDASYHIRKELNA